MHIAISTTLSVSAGWPRLRYQAGSGSVSVNIARWSYWVTRLDGGQSVAKQCGHCGVTVRKNLLVVDTEDRRRRVRRVHVWSAGRQLTLSRVNLQSSTNGLCRLIYWCYIMLWQIRESVRMACFVFSICCRCMLPLRLHVYCYYLTNLPSPLFSPSWSSATPTLSFRRIF